MNDNVVSINVSIAQRLLRNITSLIDNEIEITQEEHTIYITQISRLLLDETLGNELHDNLIIARQHLRNYSRFIGIIKERYGHLSRR